MPIKAACTVPACRCAIVPAASRWQADGPLPREVPVGAVPEFPTRDGRRHAKASDESPLSVRKEKCFTAFCLWLRSFAMIEAKIESLCTLVFTAGSMSVCNYFYRAGEVGN